MLKSFVCLVVVALVIGSSTLVHAQRYRPARSVVVRDANDKKVGYVVGGGDRSGLRGLLISGSVGRTAVLLWMNRDGTLANEFYDAESALFQSTDCTGQAYIAAASGDHYREIGNAAFAGPGITAYAWDPKASPQTIDYNSYQNANEPCTAFSGTMTVVAARGAPMFNMPDAPFVEPLHLSGR